MARNTSCSCATTGPVKADEEVVEAAVVEVVLDPGAADPADAAVDDDQLAMVDVAELAHAPAPGAGRGRRLRPRAQPRRAHDADIDATREQAAIELAARPVGPRALPVHDKPDVDALGRLGEQRRREPSPIVPGLKPNWLMCTEEAAARDVGQHRREEAAPPDVDLRRGGAALVEREREIGEADRRAHQALRAPADAVH